jgi:ATP-dependent protease ClpP protease subunit
MTTPIEDGKGYAVERVRAAIPTGEKDGHEVFAAGPATATLYLYDVLGVDLFGGIPARQVVEDLAALGPVEALDVRINSPGGDVFEAIAVYGALVRFPARVTVHIDGIAASAASLVAMAGDRTLIAEMRRQADVLDKAWSGMLATYARRTGRRAATFEQRVADAGGEWWLTAAEAVSEGFADAISRPEKQAQVFGLSRFQKVPPQLAAAAKDGVLAPSTVVPRVVEIAPPRVTRPCAEDEREAAAAARRRVVDVLRVSA